MTLHDAVAAQLSCRGCPLRVAGPVPVHVPLHTAWAPGLLVLPRPYSDVITPAADPRRSALQRVCPGLRHFAVTYLTSCWSDPSANIPDRSVHACRRHRHFEVAALQPRVIVTVGAQACEEYVVRPWTEAAGQAWQHASGATVVPLAERPEDWRPEDIELLTFVVNAAGEGAHELL